MRPAVVTAVLLLVGIVNTEAAQNHYDRLKICTVYTARYCNSNLWISFDGDRCMKLFIEPKNFQEAKAHCKSLDSELLSIHDEVKMKHAKCLGTYFSISADPKPFWIGAQRSGGAFKYTDGTEFNYTNWLPNQPDNYLGQEDCIEMSVGEWGKWNDNRCSGKKNFACMKISTSPNIDILPAERQVQSAS